MARRLEALQDTASWTDASLVRAASVNNEAALAELYRRHAAAAERVARGVTVNRDDAADAVAEAFTRVFTALTSGRVGTFDFRSYLLAATRNAAIDHLRRCGRVGPSADLATIDKAEPQGGPPDLLLAEEECALIAQAFRDLPERWQSVLWLTEVERVPPAEAAGVLGVSPNNVSQLALRARARLRERYLQALVHNHAGPECQSTIDHLGAYVAGTLSAGRRAAVEEHLAGCAPCRHRQADVEDLGASLRRAVPVPLTAAGLLHRLGRDGGGGAPPFSPPPPPAPASAPAATATAPSTILASGAPPTARARPRRAAARSAAVDAAQAATNPVLRVATSVVGSPVTHAFATNAVATMAPVAAAEPVRRWVAAVVAALAALVPGVGGADPNPPAPPLEASVAAVAAPAPLDAQDAGAGTQASGSHGADPQGAVPQGADPQAADPEGAAPEDADPEDADPEDADPEGADPGGADPQGADPEGADAEGADPPPPPAPVPAPASVTPGLPAPPAVARPAAFTSHAQSSVAEALAPTLDVFTSSDGSVVSDVLPNPQPSGAPLVLYVLEEQDGWLHTLLPASPNSSTGWVRAEEVEVTDHSYSIVVELDEHQLTVFDGNQPILNEVVAVGTETTTAPGGLYYTNELIEPPDPGGAYGPYAYGVSGFSEVVDGGDGAIGIHGTDDPSSLGHDVSDGGIRMSNAGITTLAGTLPLGVPVEVRP